jgi:hypothetical protein
VPNAGVGQPYSWVESAVDALSARDLSRWIPPGTKRDAWSVGLLAYVLERYNGFGYRNFYPFVKSPYLWSFSNIYSRGKYYGDKKFSPTLISQQCGGMVLLAYMQSTEPDVAVALGKIAPPPEPEESEDAHARPTPHPPPGASDFPADVVKYPGRYLLREASGPEVKALQVRLAAVGAAPNITSVFDLPTELAVELFQARSVDDAGCALEVDGVVGPVTWAALFGPSSVEPARGPAPHHETSGGGTTLRDALLSVAASQVGVMENPPGSNRGPEVDQYLTSAGVALGNFWCMAFVYWCLNKAAHQAGAVNRIPRSGLVLDVWNRSQHLPEITVVRAEQARANPALVRPGMVFFLSFGHGAGHCGIVADNVNGVLATIEGNTNNDGSRNGIGVFERNRRLSGGALLGFCDYC